MSRLAFISVLVASAALCGCAVNVGTDEHGHTRDSTAVRACDTAVDNLLNSKDPVEIQRAKAIIDELNCSVEKRLPR